VFLVLQKTLAPGLAVVKDTRNQQLSFSDTRLLPHLHLELKWHALVLMSLNVQERTEMKSIYAIALAGIVSFTRDQRLDVAQANSGQTGGNAAGQGAGSQAGGGGAGGAGGK
jgi:hypothetical protein